MKTTAQKKKSGQTGEDLWAWAERSATPVIREEPAETEAAPPPYHGAIRHVQSDATLNFSVWQDAVEFIQKYVLLNITPKPQV